MELKDMIYRRKSCRNFTGKAVDESTLDKIRNFKMKPLHPEINVHWNIVPRKQVKCLCPWTTPQLITVYSEKKKGWLENVGFMFQQMDLYLQAAGLGVCWLGMGKINPKNAPAAPKGMEFVIMLAFGYPRGEHLRPAGKGFRRKDLHEISDRVDPCLEAARVAPSSVNSQPWYFIHEGDIIHVYCLQKGMESAMNRIDMGIALAHLFVENPDSFSFFGAETPPSLPGYGYIGSINI